MINSITVKNFMAHSELSIKDIPEINIIKNVNMHTKTYSGLNFN